MDNLPILPGRGLNTPSAIEMRVKYLKENGFELNELYKSNLNVQHIKTNIEFLIGSVEIPVGVVGPLLFADKRGNELVYAPAATLEGALVASMNRGAKAISLSGGFRAHVLRQSMVRSPAFILPDLDMALVFTRWVSKNFKRIKHHAEHFSNHAKLIEIEPVVIGKNVQLRFSYSTEDASGQNMTTTCTWHAMLWVVDHFEQEKKYKITDFVLEGNGASDKKFSHYSQLKGRGIHVVAECFLNEEVISKILRTSSDLLLKYYSSSVLLSKMDGMAGYSINAANAVAAIFAATGQDLGSVHESAAAFLYLEKTENGLYLSVNLPSLVVGTVGGGTHLPVQAEALELMKCKGDGKVERFAKLIAGFVLGLEISTYAAIVSGEFAKAHEKLGRNKPVQWLTRAELNSDFVRTKILNYSSEYFDTEIVVDNETAVENGIITALTNRVTKKLIGFVPVTIAKKENTKKCMLKSKPLDIEVIKGLHAMAASIDPVLSDLLFRYKDVLEYNHCHRKEILMYKNLQRLGFDLIPTFFGAFEDSKREIFVFLMEQLDEKTLVHINSQKHAEWWTSDQKIFVIKAMAQFHLLFEGSNLGDVSAEIKVFEPWKAVPLYLKLMDLMISESANYRFEKQLLKIRKFVEQWNSGSCRPDLPLTVVHNDFNSRNIAIRNNGEPAIYDWELAVLNLPHRDLVEFLSFVLMPDFQETELIDYFRLHYGLMVKNNEISWDNWVSGYEYAVKEYIATRISFYEVAGILARYAFSERVLEVSLRIWQIVKVMKLRV